MQTSSLGLDRRFERGFGTQRKKEVFAVDCITNLTS